MIFGGLAAGFASLLLVQSALAQGLAAQSANLDVQVPNVIRQSVRLGHTDPNRTLHVSLSLPVANQSGLESFVDSVSNPKSPNYRKFITPEEIGVDFGLPLSAVNGVRDYLVSQGFKIRLVGKNRMSILADCTVAQAEAAFHTTINDYQALSPSAPGNPSYFSFSTPLQAPISIAPYVLDVTGLESFTKPHPLSTLTPTQTRTLYNLAPIYSGGMHGEGRNVAISNFDGYRLTNVPLYYSQYGLPTPSGGAGSNITVVAISGGAGGGTPQGEGDLDIQMALGMAPLCNFTIYDGGASDLIGVLTREANDNLADVISESYGWSLAASTATSAHNLHLSMSAEGITYMAASGDSGTTLEPYSYPDYDPEVLMVGGSSAAVDASGNRTSEVGWNSGGGGWSTNTATFNVLPSWQHATGVPTTINKRLVPDVAFHASGTQTSTAGAYFFYFNGSLTGGYIGTSFASPVFAGMLGVAEQDIISLGGLPADGSGHHRFGRIQDLLYAQNMRSDVWLDLTSGANGTLPNGSSSTAGTGWDFVTGLGVMNMNAFVGTQASSTPDFTISATPSSQTVVQGSGTSYTVNTSALNGFSGSVSLTISGLPS
ncbi:MAG TPA: protease pro-enzyme activation domain-containing protein, partial [Fimbriimonadaceae bacterium]|nr:protease pro-enzyme activation domain-containing protein [Fimbriimonadaceae bacterium]